MKTRSPIALAAVMLVCACEYGTAAGPRVTSPDESRWLLLGIQLRLDSIRPILVALQGRSFQPSALDEISDDVAFAADRVDAASDSDQLRAARYAVDVAGVAADLVQVHAQAAARGIGGVVNASCSEGMRFIRDARAHLRSEPWWALRSPAEADRVLDLASVHAENAMRVAPIANVMKTGVQAAAITSAASSLARLALAAPTSLARLAQFLRAGGASDAALTVEFQHGVGALAIATSGRALVITTGEAIALAEEGALSAAALQILFRAAHLHHIATDKNETSDARGGPWTPRFRDIFKEAGLSLDDEANLVEIEGHQGPHPEAYHQEVLARLREGTGGIRPSTPEFRAALTRTLRKLAREIQTPGTRLNMLVTGGAPP